MNDTFCVMPHLALSVQNYGDVCACNLSNESYRMQGRTYTVDQGPLAPVWNSETRHQIVSSLDNGIRHPGCQACWHKEDSGLKSARQTHNENFSHIIPAPDQPRVLIIKPGNTCNAACRMCNPATSSSWYRDDFQRQKLRNSKLDFRVYIQDFETVRNSFNASNPTFWPTIADWYHKLEFIDIYGGEPWLIDGLWRSLEQAVINGHSLHIDLRLSTNASQWNKDYMDLLSRFRSVEIRFSFDSHEKSQFEYIRHKLDFDQCVDITRRFIAYATDRQDVFQYRVNVSPTMLNIYNLDEIDRGLTDMLMLPVNLSNFVTGPDEYYDVRHLPRKIKQELFQRFQNNPRMLSITNFLHQTIPGCSMWWPKFCMETDKLDKIRAQSIATALPAWRDRLEPFWDYQQHHPEWF